MPNTQVSNPHDCKNILSMVLLTVQQRFLTAKKDIEGLILLLNQELVAKEYLMAKVCFEYHFVNNPVLYTCYFFLKMNIGGGLVMFSGFGGSMLPL